MVTFVESIHSILQTTFFQPIFSQQNLFMMLDLVLFSPLLPQFPHVGYHDRLSMLNALSVSVLASPTLASMVHEATGKV